MSSVQAQDFSSPAEYLAFERAATERHEYLDGFIYAMAGESLEHGIIGANLITTLNLQLRGKPCLTFTPNMKVYSRLPTDRAMKGLFAYPDVLVVCGKPLFHDEHRDVIVNPQVIIEILSKSTEGYDRGEKFARYRQNASLTDYLLVSQAYPNIEHFTRRADGHWDYSFATDLEARLSIASLDCQLHLAEVYDRIEFPAEPVPEDLPLTAEGDPA